jgi:hypothetical protein
LIKEVNGIQAGCLKTLQTRWEGRNKLSFQLKAINVNVIINKVTGTEDIPA